MDVATLKEILNNYPNNTFFDNLVNTKGTDITITAHLVKDYYEDSNRVLIFRVGDQLFKKTGYVANYDDSWDDDSWGYDENAWDGELVEVEPVEEKVITYKVKE